MIIGASDVGPVSLFFGLWFCADSVNYFLFWLTFYFPIFCQTTFFLGQPGCNAYAFKDRNNIRTYILWWRN